ncbi:hypothetical protein IAU60_001791 [Kwoniella sp. DSM 27419]
MAMLTPGAKCSVCPLVDFLPFDCPSCHRIYCSNHIASHGCQDDAESSTQAVGKLSRGKKTCEVTSCQRESIESVAGVSDTAEVDMAREVRCTGCGGAYCVEHRSQAAHSCTAPLVHHQRHDAFLERRAKARELVSQHFPDHGSRVIPKPPPPRDIIRKKPPSPERLPPSLQARLDPAPESSGPTAASRVKTKAEKLWDIHLRKVRSMATPLVKGAKAEGERRFFEWSIDLSQARVDVWRETAKMNGKPDRAWVPIDMPVGKMMDLIIAAGKVNRPKTASDPPLQLLCLYPEPDGPRTVNTLSLSEPAGSQVVEGSLVVLVKQKS